MDLPTPTHPVDARYGAHAALFAEELGLVIEVAPAHSDMVASLFNQAGVPCTIIGRVRERRKAATGYDVQTLECGERFWGLPGCVSGVIMCT